MDKLSREPGVVYLLATRRDGTVGRRNGRRRFQESIINGIPDPKGTHGAVCSSARHPEGWFVKLEVGRSDPGSFESRLRRHRRPRGPPGYRQTFPRDNATVYLSTYLCHLGDRQAIVSYYSFRIFPSIYLYQSLSFIHQYFHSFSYLGT